MAGRFFIRLSAFILIAASVTACKPRLESSMTSNVERLGESLYRTYIPTEDFEKLADPGNDGLQRSSNWCWAAVTQMILNFHGISVSQEQLVKEMYGGLVDKPATPLQVARLLNTRRWGDEAKGRKIRAEAYSYAPTNAVLELLYENQPLLLGLRLSNGGKHAFALTSAEFIRRRDKSPMIQRLSVYDPWPSNQRSQVYEASEVNGNVYGMVLIRVEKNQASHDERRDPVPVETPVATLSPAASGIGGDMSCPMQELTALSESQEECQEWIH